MAAHGRCSLKVQGTHCLLSCLYLKLACGGARMHATNMLPSDLHYDMLHYDMDKTYYFQDVIGGN